MCRTFDITYDQCLHIKTNRKRCSESRSILAIFRPNCDRTKIEAHVGDFCEDCRVFFDSHGVSTGRRRELVLSYRVAHTCHEALTPIVGRKDGEFTFHMDPVGKRIFSLSSDRKDDETRLSMLEAASWVLPKDEMPAPAAARARQTVQDEPHKKTATRRESKGQLIRV
ncbi:hypothetical protein BUE80_DR006974 [Diplocarpon rosae]|nr:hypothetical protein BUE80_DR006974 [Diplocarpon rosae]